VLKRLRMVVASRASRLKNIDALRMRLATAAP
jgi:hypothetical protein